MLPKPKEPVLEAVGPELGAKLVSLVAADMQRAKRAQEAQEQKAEAAKAKKRGKRERA